MLSIAAILLGSCFFCWVPCPKRPLKSISPPTFKARLWENRAELGFMGLKFPTQFQVKAHAMTRNLREANFPAHPEGWHTQISNGVKPSRLAMHYWGVIFVGWTL